MINYINLCGGALQLGTNGDIIYKDKILVNDKEIVDAFRNALNVPKKEFNVYSQQKSKDGYAKL